MPSEYGHSIVSLANRLEKLEGRVEQVIATNQKWMERTDGEQTNRHQENQRALREISAKIDLLESWKDKLTGSWWVLVIVGVGANIVGKSIVEHLWK